MGQLVNGVWQKGWYDPDGKGAFQRPATKFRQWPAEANPARYHLYVSHACPWAHRAILTRAIREIPIGMTVVDPHMGDDGWTFGEDASLGRAREPIGEPDPLFDAKYLRDIYLRAAKFYSGRVTVPVLWDKKANVIVNNESRQVMRILDTVFDGKTSLAPPDLLPEIDRTLDRIYDSVNNGVYRAGFATQQGPYEAAVHDIFTELDRCEAILARTRYLCGNVLTEADIALFTTLFRFDTVYYSHFKCNVKRIQDYPNLWGYVRDIYQRPEVKASCRIDHVKTHYYWSQTTVNPHRIIPVGPTIDFDAPHGRLN